MLPSTAEFQLLLSSGRMSWHYWCLFMAFRAPFSRDLGCSLGIWGGEGLVGEGLSSQCFKDGKGKEVIPALQDVPAGDAELSRPGGAGWDLELPGITA